MFYFSQGSQSSTAFLSNVWKLLFHLVCLYGLLPMVYDYLFYSFYIIFYSELFYPESLKWILTIHSFFTSFLENFVRHWRNRVSKIVIILESTWVCGEQTFKIIIRLSDYSMHMPAIMRRWMKCHCRPEEEEIIHNWNGLGAERNR